MFWVQDDGADQSGQFYPCQHFVQTSVSVFITRHQPLELKPGGDLLLVCGNLRGVGRQGQRQRQCGVP